jgi:cytochrome c peroxidase
MSMPALKELFHIFSKLWPRQRRHLSWRSALQRTSRYVPTAIVRLIDLISSRISAGTAVTYLNILLGVCSWLFVGFLASCASALLSAVPAAVAPPLSDASQVRAAGEEPITPIPAPPIADPQKLALGAQLFSDTRLSAAGNFACSSCHDLRTNGAGGAERQAEKDGSESPFNTLTVFNAALSFRLSWQGHFRDLAEQAEASIENPANMHSSLDDVARRLNSDPEMVGRFRTAYESAPDRDNILDAIVTFERSLLTPNSRFDRWLQGDASALTPGELEGYDTFKSLGCISCHQGVNVGGNLFQRLGVFHSKVREGPPRIMRVPSLRNIAVTAPYFHDGSATTIEDAVRRMGKAQLDRALTDQQIASLVSFLNTLTGSYRGQPVVGGKP